MKSKIVVLALALGSLLLTACQGSSNNSTPTTSTCGYSGYSGYSGYPSYGSGCTTAASQCVMTAQGYAINQLNGQPCTSQTYNTSTMGAYNPYGAYGAGGYGGVSGYSSNPCAAAYGPTYQPMNYGGQMVCVGY